MPPRIALALVMLTAPAFVDGPADNLVDNVRRVPKLGIEPSPADRDIIERGLSKLGESLDQIAGRAEKGDLSCRTHDADVRIFHKAVRDALIHREFFDEKVIDRAKTLLVQGQERADRLLAGSTPWADQTGLVVRGYRSRIDGSVQPYGLVIPKTYSPVGGHRFRLDLWFHGRGEALNEVNFLDERQRQPGTFTPEDTIVLHPYGRYCNAFKFAGEVDVLEALDDAKAKYRVDDDRISVRGFSMGGAACWQFAVHYSDRWFAANPGAGFAETPRFLDVFQKEKLEPTWYEKKLWHLYDCTDWALNLAQCPAVAYSGELDTQKQAADVMAEALSDRQIELTHVIGPKTKHSYHADSAREVERRMVHLAARGRPTVPKSVKFETYTLKYNRMNWVTIDAMKEHWTRAHISANIYPTGGVFLTVGENVEAFTLEMPAGSCPFEVGKWVGVFIGGGHVLPEDDGFITSAANLNLPGPASGLSWRHQFHREGGKWKEGPLPDPKSRKRHGLQGPIDDAFMDPFVFVRPTGTSANEKVGAWAKSEMDRAIERWRRQFRGDARVIDDTAVTDAEIARSNLVLWGDPESNAVLKRIVEKLPIGWNGEAIKAGDRSYSAEDHALILIAPNPLNPDRYVVLNSGFTYREYDDLNNARQVPKLPDWAVIDVRVPPNSRWPGKVVDADFFDENWRLRTGDAARR